MARNNDNGGCGADKVENGVLYRCQKHRYARDANYRRTTRCLWGIVGTL